MEDHELNRLIEQSDRASSLAITDADRFLATLRLTPAEAAFAREQAAIAVVNIRRAWAGTFLTPGVVCAALMAGSLMAERIELEINAAIESTFDVSDETRPAKRAA